MYALAIETSCDETAVAVLQFGENGLPVVSAELVASQSEVHRDYGGVVPELASREHLRNLPLLLDEVFRKSGIGVQNLALIGVTRGPGLKGCLLIGLGMAQGLSLAWNVPLVGVNHIEGHLYSALLSNPQLEFPFLALVISGGHTEIHEVHGIGSYKLVARTIDDAAGEAFDKSAHLLGFLYPGGPALAELADQTGRSRFKLPRVMRESEGFSFSGLKTAISQLVRDQKANLGDGQLRGELAFAAQEAIVDALLFKLRQAVKRSGISTVTVSGGVSANRFLRAKLAAEKGMNVCFPEFRHCVDNAAMIGLVAVERFRRGERIAAGAGVLSRWPVDSMQPPCAP